MFMHVHDNLSLEVDFICFILAGRVGPEADEEVDPYQPESPAGHCSSSSPTWDHNHLWHWFSHWGVTFTTLHNDIVGLTHSSFQGDTLKRQSSQKPHIQCWGKILFSHCFPSPSQNGNVLSTYRRFLLFILPLLPTCLQIIEQPVQSFSGLQ